MTGTDSKRTILNAESTEIRLGVADYQEKGPFVANYNGTPPGTVYKTDTDRTLRNIFSFLIQQSAARMVMAESNAYLAIIHYPS